MLYPDKGTSENRDSTFDRFELGKKQSQISAEEANINDSRVPQVTKLISTFFPVTKDYTATGSKNKPNDQKQEQLHRLLH